MKFPAVKLFLFIPVLLAAALPVRGADPIQVASFSSIVTEIARDIGGDHVQVAGLVQPGVDPHEYQPTPADLKVVSRAQLILTSGKHLESYLGKLEETTGGKAKLVEVGENLPALEMKHEEGGGHGEGAVEDPHWWHSVGNVKKATQVVRDALIAADPAHEADYQARAKAYLAQLDELEKWVKRKVAELPRDRRKLVTSHDAFQYFARDYGFTILAVEGLSTDTEPSNRHVSELIDTIKKEKVKAVFTESTVNPKVTQEVTRETGARMGGMLHADGLGEGDASTYAGMMRHNVSTIVDSLK